MKTISEVTEAGDVMEKCLIEENIICIFKALNFLCCNEILAKKWINYKDCKTCRGFSQNLDLNWSLKLRNRSFHDSPGQ